MERRLLAATVGLMLTSVACVQPRPIDSSFTDSTPKIEVPVPNPTPVTVRLRTPQPLIYPERIIIPGILNETIKEAEFDDKLEEWRVPARGSVASPPHSYMNNTPSVVYGHSIWDGITQAAYTFSELNVGESVQIDDRYSRGRWRLMVEDMFLANREDPLAAQLVCGPSDQSLVRLLTSAKTDMSETNRIKNHWILPRERILEKARVMGGTNIDNPNIHINLVVVLARTDQN